MSPEQRTNILIAEAIGTHTVSRITPNHWHVTDQKGRIWQIIDVPDGIKGENMPRDFERVKPFNSCLNACAEMEATLTPQEEAFYKLKLSSITHKNGRDRNVFATAPQRCEAFLRVKGIIQ